MRSETTEERAFGRFIGPDLGAFCDARLPVASSDRAKVVRASIDTHLATSLV